MRACTHAVCKRAAQTLSTFLYTGQILEGYEFIDFPAEILLNILMHFIDDPHTLGRIASVNKSLKQLVTKTHDLWTQINLDKLTAEQRTRYHGTPLIIDGTPMIIVGEVFRDTYIRVRNKLSAVERWNSEWARQLALIVSAGIFAVDGHLGLARYVYALSEPTRNELSNEIFENTMLHYIDNLASEIIKNNAVSLDVTVTEAASLRWLISNTVQVKHRGSERKRYTFSANFILYINAIMNSLRSGHLTLAKMLLEGLAVAEKQLTTDIQITVPSNIDLYPLAFVWPSTERRILDPWYDIFFALGKNRVDQTSATLLALHYLPFGTSNQFEPPGHWARQLFLLFQFGIDEYPVVLVLLLQDKRVRASHLSEMVITVIGDRGTDKMREVLREILLVRL